MSAKKDEGVISSTRFVGIGMLLAILGCGEVSSSAGLITERLRCVVDTAFSRIALQQDTTITFDQPDLYRFAVNSRGETFASPVGGGALLHWSPEGVLLPLIGSPGEGPGQFAVGPVTPFVTKEDSLYVRDNHLHWVVFDTGGKFVRFSPTGPISASALGTIQFTDEGLVLSSDQRSGEPYSLLVVSRTGDVRRRIHRLEHSVMEWSPRRAVTATGKGTFWVGPELYARGGYAVELWDNTGEILKSLHRTVPWYVADSLLHPLGPDAPKSVRDPLARPFLFPRVEQLVWDVTGKLWIVTQVPTSSRARERILSTRSLPALEAASLRELAVHIEVLDPVEGEIIAATVLGYGFLLMAQARDGIRVQEDSATGLRTAIKYRLRLVDSSGNSCS
jgi:hypothetical protein